MEQHLEDLARAQKKKLSVAQRRAMELEALRPSQDAQTLKGMPEGEMISGGEAGLRRVVGGKLRGGAYRDSQFGVINEPYSNQLEGGAKYGKMLGEHLMKTKGGAFVKDFQKGLMSCAEQRAKMPYSKVVLPCEAEAQMGARQTMREMMSKKPSGVGMKGGRPAGGAKCSASVGGRATGGKSATCSAKGGAMPTGGKRTLPPALRKRADAMKRLIREEGMTFKEAIEYLKRNPPQ